jgi:hypothetical protein
MSGAILPLPQYAFMAWCSVKKCTGTTLPLPLKEKKTKDFELKDLKDSLNSMRSYLRHECDSHLLLFEICHIFE